MSPDELRDRFLAKIDARGRDDKYIDGVEEREILQIAYAHGFPADQARGFLVETCRGRGYVVEAGVVQLIRETLKTATRPDGRIDRPGFEAVVGAAAKAVAGTDRTPRDVAKLVVQTMDDAGATRVKTGLFRDWYARARRDAGLPPR